MTAGMWGNAITTGSTTTGYVTGTTAVYLQPMAVTSSAASGIPAPRQQAALEWLDREVEQTCALARG